MLAGCIEPSPRSDITRALNDVSFAPPAPAPGPSPTSAGVGPSQPAEAPLQAQIYGGRTVAAQRPATGGAQRSADGVQLNFEQAEIRDVIKVILGDIIGRSYTVDSDVQGQVTLSTSAPMSEGDLLAVLETVLRANGATLVETSPDTFRIMPVDAAIGRSAGGAAGRAADRRSARATASRSCPCATSRRPRPPSSSSRWWPRPRTSGSIPAATPSCSAAPGVERQNVVETLADLDVDWMAGKAIGLFPLAARQCRGGHPRAAGDLRTVRPDRLRALADPLPAPGPAERGSGDRRRPGAGTRGRLVGLPARPWPGGGLAVLRLQSQAWRRRGHREAAQRGVQRGAGFRQPGRASPPPAPRWAPHRRSARMASRRRRLRRQQPGHGARGKPDQSPARSRSWRARPTTRC